MRVCREISRWVTENVQRPLEEWVERTERRCREQPCNWWCLCCNKWFCFLVTFFVRVVVWVTVTVTKLVTEVVCTIIAIVLDIVAAVVNLILSIPVIGGIIRAILNWVTDIILRLASIPDLLLSLAGVMIPKKIYVKGVILNANGVPLTNEAAIMPSITLARQIFLRECNVQLIYTGTCTPQLSTPTEAQTIDCGSSGFFADLLGIQGAHFEFVSADCGFENGFNRVVGYASEIMVFVVSDIQPPTTVGCSFSSTHNYVTIEAGNLTSTPPDTIAHEIGHACALTHSENIQNLMFPNSTRAGSTMSAFQRAWFRSSKHCVFI